MKKVIVIVGPTGTGKTDLGLRLAQKYKTEIISGDSVQVYRSLNIGSAKASEKEMQGIKHYLIDILDPNEQYSVSDFQKQSRILIDEISLNGSIPIIVGGTGFYIKAALFDYEFTEEKRTNEFESLSNNEIYERLVNLKDPEIPNINNRKRLLRHLEIMKNSPIKSITKNSPLFDYLIIGLNTDRAYLYERINQRVDKMFEDGLIDEVSTLYNKYDKGIVHEAIGYKEFAAYFKNESSLEEVKEKIKQDTRNFAKRQITWFNNQMSVNWIDIKTHNSFEEAVKIIDEFIKK